MSLLKQLCKYTIAEWNFRGAEPCKKGITGFENHDSRVTAGKKGKHAESEVTISVLFEP